MQLRTHQRVMRELIARGDRVVATHVNATDTLPILVKPLAKRGVDYPSCYAGTAGNRVEV